VKVAILGTAAHCVKAPFDDSSWEIWGCNFGTLARWDRWFDLHTAAVVDTHPGHRQRLYEWAKTKPVYMQEAHAGESVLRYPVEAVSQKYGTWFFTSTISYMLALAIEEGATDIALYGVDLADATEYAAQKPGCRFFIQTALLNGIRVTGPAEAEVFVPGKLYGYGKPHPWAYKLKTRKDELMGRYRELEQRQTQISLAVAALKGALDVTVAKEEIPAMLNGMAAEMTQIQKDMLMFDGAIQGLNHIEFNWIGDTT
jgi:hypothetical protein